MDFFQRVGNFLTGGGWSSNSERGRSDAERKRREEEERRRREAARIASQQQAIKKQQTASMDMFTKAPTKTIQRPDAPKPEAIKTAPRTTIPSVFKMPTPPKKDPDTVGLTDEDARIVNRFKKEGKKPEAINRFVTAARENNKIKSRADYENSIPGRIANTGLDVARTLALDIPAAMAGTAADVGTQAVGVMNSVRNIGNPEAQARDLEGVRAAREFLQKNFKDSRGNNVVQPDWKFGDWWDLAGRSLTASLDLAITPGVKVGAKAAKTVYDEAVKSFESTVGRKPTAQEIKTIEDDINTQLEIRQPEPSAPKDNSTPARAPDVATAPPEAREVATSYQTIYNSIVNNKAITPQQQAELITEARKRHVELLKQLDTKTEEGVQAQAAVVQQADEAVEAQAQQQADTIAQVQQERAEAVAPTPEQVVQTVPEPTPEVQANNVYRDTQRLIEENQAIRDAQKRTPRDVADSVGRQLYDPLLRTQGVDNQLFRKLKDEGKLEPGQSSLRPSQSIRFQTGLISNPNQAVEVIARGTGLGDIIQKRRREGTESEFEIYRIYKDELWRVQNGAKNTLPVNEAEMATFVRDMEARHADWVTDNATLREISLNNFKQRLDAGVEDPALFEAAVQNPFYTPRRNVQTEDAIKPTINNVFNRAGKTTAARQEGVRTTESPLDLFEIDIRNTVVARASQRRAELLREAGMDVTQSAEDAVMRKAIIDEVTQLSDLRKSLAGDLSKTGTVNKKAIATIKSAEDKVVSSITKMLDKARGNRDDVLNDVVDRDPRYDIEKRQIESQKFDNLTPKEAREQIKYDLKQLDEKYPSPEKMRRENILEFARSLGDEARGVDGRLSQIDEAIAVSDAAKAEVESLRAMMRQAKAEGGELWEELRNYAVNPKTGQAEVTYKVNGVTGKIAIPPSLAKEWSVLDSAFDASVVNRILGGVGGFQKTFWTGLFSPVFQILQTIRNWGQMFTNAEGLSAFRPEAIAQFYKSLFSTKGRNSFRQMFNAAGAQYENATRSIMLRRSITDDIANTSSFKEYISRNPLRTLSDVGRTLNNVLAHISNAQRDQVIAGAVGRYKALGYSDEMAKEAAINAATRVFGNFNEVSRFARVLDDTLLPYAGATQAGVRADLRAFKERPAETAAKYGLMIGAMTGIVAWNLQNNASEYYKTMQEEGREDDYQNSIVIALGTVSRNEDGTWNNLIKIPLTPDFRPIHRAAIEAMRAADNGDVVDPVFLGAQVFNYMTGDVSGSVYDPGRSDEGRNPLGGAFTSSLILNLGRITAGESLWDGGKQVDKNMYNAPRSEQAYDSTTGAARFISDATGNLATPIQADQFLGLLGGFGRATREATDEKEGGGFNPVADFMRAFTAGKSASDEQKSNRTYFDDLEDVQFEIQDLKQRELFEALNQKRTSNKDLANKLGVNLPTDQSNVGMLDAATKALALLGNEEVLEAYMKMEDKKRARGEMVNPLYDRNLLTPEQRNAILTYRQAKINNSAGQNRDKNGDSAFTALGLDEKWYEQFKQSENRFYELLGEDGEETSPRTFSGQTKVQPTPELQGKLDYYYTLARGTGDRSRFLRANPDVLAYWEQQNDFTNAEREALGFKPIEEEDESSFGGGSSGSYDPFGLLGRVTNLGDDIKRLDGASEEPYIATSEELEKQLRSLFASRRGGRADVQIGAQSRGDNS